MTTSLKKRLVDSFQRSVSYLRISVTDRCNLNCRYCAPFMPCHMQREQMLTMKEIYRLASIGAGMGITKIRLTGGEPLVRKGIVGLLGRLSRLEGIRDLGLTTNGTLLAERTRALKEAGLNRINISLDTLEREKFRELTGADLFSQVWAGIMSAAESGFHPLKINTVMMKGFNDNELEAIAALSMRYPFHIRFIEYMPIGTDPLAAESNFMSISDLKTRLERMGNLIPVASQHLDGPARRFRFEGAPGEIGLIGSMSAHFCATCNRLRLTAAGCLRPCLLSDNEIDIKTPMRSGASDSELEQIFIQAVASKRGEHHLTFGRDQVLHTKMVSIGG
jgi:cyclic pyranopterin phosphate synthase